MTLATAWNPQWAGSASGARAYIENIVEALDEEGEFYFDVKANKVHLVSSKDPTTDSIVMAGFTQLLTATKASPVSFTALAFEYAAVETQSCFTGGCNGQSADFLTQAAVEVHESYGITFNQCSFSHVGGYAVWFGPNSTDSSLTNSHIFDVGAGGVRIGNGSLNQKTSGHVVENNLIEDGGHVYQEGCGVLAQIGIDCAIKHNEIRYFRYTGISTGWTWGYGNTPVQNYSTHFNHIHHIGLGYLSDMGCVYTLGHQPGSTVKNNICHDVQSYNYGGWAYYTDEGSRDEVFSFNIATRIKCAGHHQHYGTDNLLTNNIYTNVNVGDVPTPGRKAIRMSDCDSAIRASTHKRNVATCHPDTAPTAGCCCHPGCDQGKCSSWHFEKNIVYQPTEYRGTLLESTFVHGFDNFSFDANVYWKESTNFSGVFNGTTFKDWQSAGKDVSSLIADPRFSNISTYQLAPSSPALPLGFQQIDISQVGPKGSVGPPQSHSLSRPTADLPAALDAPQLFNAGMIWSSNSPCNHGDLLTDPDTVKGRLKWASKEVC